MSFRKFTVVILGLLGAAGVSSCETAKRFAPPGFVKYEDLEKGIPVNPSIQKRIDETKVAGDAGYPDLSDTPQDVPTGIAKEVREELGTRLETIRDLVQSDIASARAQAGAEFGLDIQPVEIEPNGPEPSEAQKADATILQNDDAQSLSAAIEELEAKLEEARASVSQERQKPLPQPLDITGAPEQEDPLD